MAETVTDLDRLRTIDEELRNRRQILVEVTPMTRWVRGAERLGGPEPTAGYALASASTFSVHHDKHAYVTDVNVERHPWRKLDLWFATLDDAARHLFG